MTRPVIVDAFPFHDELDVLEMRLAELYDTVDRFVIVEATVTHQDRPKPLYYLDHADRFAAWSDKIIQVTATDLPTARDYPDPWAREHAQRDWIAVGLQGLDLGDGDIVMQSDVDEIPRALHARNVRPGAGLIAFGQRGHFWAVDWFYPHPWFGTVAGTVRSIARLGDRPFVRMRDMRTTAPCPPHMMDAGWHFSWLGGPDRARKKVGAFCHPEVETSVRRGIEDGLTFWRDGIHLDGVKMEPVDVDEGWPRWIREGNAPDSWFRPR